MKDRIIRCLDCGREFVWTVSEQHWFNKRGLTHTPQHCKPCREDRRQRQQGKLPLTVKYEESVEVTPASDVRNVGNVVQQLLGGK